MNGHTFWVSTVAFSPDASRFASGSDDSAVRIWDLTSGAEMAVLQGHTGEVTMVAFSPDASRLASGSVDSTVRIWFGTSGVFLQNASPAALSLWMDPNNSINFPLDIPVNKLHVYVDNSWLFTVWGQGAAEPVCHIPAEYVNSTDVVVSGRAVGWGCRNGHVLIFRLKPS